MADISLTSYMRVSIAMLIVLPLAVSVLAMPAWGASGRDLGIAAVVGEDAISSYDVENRIKFIIATANLSNTPDVVEHIKPQVIRSLIDEKLEAQEATKNNIKISPEDVDQAITSIESQRNMPPGTIGHILDSNHVPKETFTQQIRAQLLWNKLLIQKVRPQVRVSDEDITMASKNFTPPVAQKEAMSREYKVTTIMLPVDKPSREKEVRRLADKLVKEIRGGASFEEVSRQFSSDTASSGGKVETFWVRLEQLDPHVAKVLMTAKTGSITDPVRTSVGYTIIKVNDTRAIGKNDQEDADKNTKDTEITMKEILLKLKPKANDMAADAIAQIGEEVAKNPGTCDEKSIASIKDKALDNFDIEVNVNRQMLSKMPPAQKVLAENLKVGNISTPFASREGIRLYMLCGKKGPDAKAVDREQVYHMLIQQKMELEAQKYLRNLRREIFVDIR